MNFFNKYCISVYFRNLPLWFFYLPFACLIHKVKMKDDRCIYLNGVLIFIFITSLLHETEWSPAETGGFVPGGLGYAAISCLVGRLYPKK